MDFLIITGLSGAGKSHAADVLEDLGYFCADNMPLALVPHFAELCSSTAGRYEKTAVIIECRGKDDCDELVNTLETLHGMNCAFRILYMEADVHTIVRRYKEFRRPHPLAQNGMSIEQAIHTETDMLAPIRERADFIVDSSDTTLGQLQNKLFGLFAEDGQKKKIDVTVMSFGYKHGLPMEADLVFDVRFLPNPFYVEELRHQTGLDRPVAEYVLNSPETHAFMERLQDMLDFLLPQYIEEGKLGLTVAIGCTGGHHRSVAIANALTNYLNAKGTTAVNVNRDIEK